MPDEASHAGVADPVSLCPEDALEDVRGLELMPFDDGSLSSDKAQSSAMSLVINYGEPRLAAGTALIGLNLLVLPLLAQANSMPVSEDFADSQGTFSYASHCELNRKLPLRIFTEAELKSRLGRLDAAFLLKEITMSTDELDDYMNSCDVDSTEQEVTQLNKWRDESNTHLRSLQKRGALAFLGLPPGATEADINKMYKKLALELHPDKGGDPEEFQELQEMKERLNEIEKEEHHEDEDERKAKEKEQLEQDEASKSLPPDERCKKKRMEAHDTAVRLWARAKKARDEILGDKALKSNPQPALNMLRVFVDRFVQNEVKPLRHDDVRGAELKFRKFLKQGAEIIAVAALADVHSTLSTVAMHFNYRIVARSGSPELKGRCAKLLEAISEVPVRADEFLQQVEQGLATQKDRDKHKGGSQTAAKAKSTSAKPSNGAFSAALQKSGYPEAKAKAPSKADPFADFDLPGAPPPKAMPKTKAKAAAPKAAEPPSSLRRMDQDALAVARRTTWDADFDHPYAGALRANGSGVFCRPCQRWIATIGFDTRAFVEHVEKAHPTPPPGFVLK